MPSRSGGLDSVQQVYDERDDESEGRDNSGELAAVLIGLGHHLSASIRHRNRGTLCRLGDPAHATCAARAE